MPTPSAYATLTDLANVGGLPNYLATVPAAVQTESIQAASALLDGVFGQRFTLPIVAYGLDVTLNCCWLAAYILIQRRGYNPENPAEKTFETRYDLAMKWMDRVAQKKLTPVGIVDSSPGAGPGISPPVSSPQTVNPQTGTPGQGSTWNTWARG